MEDVSSAKGRLDVVYIGLADETPPIGSPDHLTAWTIIQRGVRQGCVLSPDFFSLYGEIILRSILNEEGIQIGGRNINNIRYADDTVLIADSEEKLQN